jgi:hypothetical protein
LNETRNGTGKHSTNYFLFNSIQSFYLGMALEKFDNEGKCGIFIISKWEGEMGIKIGGVIFWIGFFSF